MSKTFKIGINWTKSAVALALLCAVFSFSAMAQNNPNEPLDANAVANLVDELKEGDDLVVYSLNDYELHGKKIVVRKLE